MHFWGKKQEKDQHTVFQMGKNHCPGRIYVSPCLYLWVEEQLQQEAGLPAAAAPVRQEDSGHLWVHRYKEL